tara:strand:+ start:174 stop:335 length:162 start_codon:yes stop_codon:yes gene_type:complete
MKHKKNKLTKKEIKYYMDKIEQDRWDLVCRVLSRINKRPKPLPQEFFILETDR